MVVYCCFPTCKNKPGSPRGISFHRFPKYSCVLSEWLQTCEVGISDIENKRICSQHFTEADYKYGNRKLRLLKDAVPKIHHLEERTYDLPENAIQDQVLMLQNQILILENKLKASKLQIKVLQQSKRRLEDIKWQRSSNLSIKRKTWYTQETQCKQVITKLMLRNRKLSQFKLKSGAIFTPTQMRMIETGQLKANWSPKDIAKFLALKCISTKAYDFIRCEWNMPLPCIRTLRNTLSQFDISVGPMLSVFRMLKEYFTNKSTMEKQIIIAYDEMAISSEVCCLNRQDRILGPFDKMQLACIRGMFTDFKIPIFLEFDKTMSKEILDELIDRLHEAGLFPRGITFDLGGGNRGLLHSRLGISLEQPYYLHESSNVKIWPFPDMAHLLKLLRNHFLDTGLSLKVNEEKKIYFSKEVLRKLIKTDCSELKTLFKLTYNHLEVKGQERQNVRKACQVFSSSVAQGIRNFSSSEDKVEIADFFQLVNDFWDITTARLPKHPTNRLKSAFGHSDMIVEQKKIINNFETAILNLTMGRKGWALKPFQIGFLLWIKSLFNLWNEFSGEDFNPQYILTSHLGQCFLENIFAQVRGLGGFSMNPSPKDCIYRVQGIMLSQLFGALKSSNTLDSEDSGDIAEHLITFLKSENNDIPSEQYEGAVIQLEREITADNWTQMYEKMTPEKKCEYGGREHIAGYLAKKFSEKFSDMEMSIIEQQRIPLSGISRGGLKVPSYKWINQFIIFDKEFVKYHSYHNYSDEYRRGNGVMKILSTYLKQRYPEVPEKVVDFFVRTRTHIRIKHLNMVFNNKVEPTEHSLRSASDNIVQ